MLQVEMLLKEWCFILQVEILYEGMVCKLFNFDSDLEILQLVAAVG